MNKIIRALAYFGIHVWVAIQVYVVSIAIISPFFNVVISVLDLANKYPKLILGKYLWLWLISSAVLWLVLYIYIEVHNYKERHKK